jgi:hypothetical protein
LEQNLAVLIDFENIAAGTEREGLGRFDVRALMQRVNDKGRILLARSYADWGRFSRFKQSLLSANVTMYELTSHGMQDKNRADIAMVVDALELAFTKDYIDTFVVVSGDSDFTPLVLKIRELNKRVIGIGTRKSTSRLLVQACDEFIFYESIVKKQTREVKDKSGPMTNQEPMTRPVAFKLLHSTLQGLQRENPDPLLASVVKGAMRRKSPDFSESDLGYASFARFLESAQKAKRVKIIRDRKSGGYRIDSFDSDEDGVDESLLEMEEPSWTDTYMPDGCGEYLKTLSKADVAPLSTPVRMSVLEAVEASVTERVKRNRKIISAFVVEDVKKALRTTHPELPLRAVRGVMRALLRAGLLIHRDGNAIRSASGPFILTKDAEALNTSLAGFYLSVLHAEGADVSDAGLLSELLLGDSKRKREVEEALAWMAEPSEVAEASESPDVDPNDIDLDDLLEMDIAPQKDEDVPAPTSELDALMKPQAKAPESPGTSASEEKVVEEEAPEPKPKAKPRAKKAAAPAKKKTTTAKKTSSTTKAKSAIKKVTAKKTTRKAAAKKPEPADDQSSDSDT